MMEGSPQTGRNQGRNVVVLLSSDVTVRNNQVFMPNTIEMAILKKHEKGQFVNNVVFTKEMTEKDVWNLLCSRLPILQNRRFCCASAVDNRTRLEFHGKRRIWDGDFLKRTIRGNSALYLLTEETPDLSRVSQGPAMGHYHSSGTVSIAGRSLLTSRQVPTSTLLSDPGYQKKTADKRKGDESAQGSFSLGCFSQEDVSPLVKQKKGNDVVVQTCGNSSYLMPTMFQFVHAQQEHSSTVAQNSNSVQSEAAKQSSVNQFSRMRTAQRQHFPTTHTVTQSIKSTPLSGITVDPGHQIHAKQEHLATSESQNRSVLAFSPVSLGQQTVTSPTVQQDLSMQCTAQGSLSQQSVPTAVVEHKGNFSHLHDLHEDFKDPDKPSQQLQQLVMQEVVSQPVAILKNTLQQHPPLAKQDILQAIVYPGEQVQQRLMPQVVSFPAATQGPQQMQVQSAREDHSKVPPVGLHLETDTLNQEALDSGWDSNIDDFLNEDHDTGQLRGSADIKIVPDWGYTGEPGTPFLITLLGASVDEAFLEGVTSSLHVAIFKDLENVILKPLSSSTWEGCSPVSQEPGAVEVTLAGISSSATKEYGKARFTYKDQSLESVNYLAIHETNPKQLWNAVELLLERLKSKDSGSDDSKSFVVPPAGSSTLNESSIVRSVIVLTLLVYKAAKINSHDFLETLFSTSAGTVVFNHYKNCATLPEDVARANGHAILGDYLENVNKRLSKDVGSEDNNKSINWLELEHVVEKKKNLPCTDDAQPASCPDSNDNQSEYDADDETSPFSSPSGIEVTGIEMLDSEYEDQGQTAKGGQPDKGNEWRPRSVGLPKRVPNFVGRIDICREITRLLTTEGDDMTYLVTMAAPPGFGKTAVAKTVGHMIIDQEKKDVLYFSLRSVSSLTCAAERLLKEIAGILADQENPVSQLTSYLTSLQNPTLLILVNAEDLQRKDESKFCKFLKDIGQHAKNLVTLITSRTFISTLDLFPFSTKHIPLQPLANEDSSTYLSNYVPGISNEHAKEFSMACRGVPLLLAITASFLRNKTVNVVDLHRKLQNCPDRFLKSKEPRIQGLYALLRVFYNNLQPEMKKALAFLASFPASFTKEEARHVLFPNEDYSEFQFMFDNLERNSLVQRDVFNGRLYFSLHPLVQAFCKPSKNETCTEYNTAIKLFSVHYLSVLRKLSDEFISTACKRAIESYQISKINIIHALLIATEDDHLKYFGLSVSTEAVKFLAMVLNMDEFMSVYSQCLQAADKLTDKTLYSDCLVSIAFKQLCYSGYSDAYRTAAKRSLQEAHELQSHLVISDTECEGLCKCKLGLCCFISGERNKGISLIAQGIAVRKRRVRSDGSGKMERMVLADGFCDLAMAMFISGNFTAAVNIWTNICLIRYRELLGTHPFTESLLHYIGDAYQNLGDPRRAVVFKKESLQMRKSLLGDNHLDTARAYYGLGCALGAVGSTEEALEYVKKAREVQVRVAASKQDIDRTEQEMNRLRLRLQQMFI